MPYTLNGVGTKYYGETDHMADGSYVTTAWFVLFFVPLLPYASYRVWEVGHGTRWLFYNSQKYNSNLVPLNWKQVGTVYLKTVLILVAIFIAAWLLKFLGALD